MATYAFLAAVLAAAAPLFDGPISTRPVIPQAATPAAPPAAAPAATPAPAPTLPVLPAREPPPDDDYGFVAFCYGAETTFLDLYDRVMPEVERIERAFPGATPVEQALADYPLLRADSRANLETYAAALRGAERASPTPIAARGVAAIRLGRNSWNTVTGGDAGSLARSWMGWSPSADCATRAKELAVPATTPSGPGALMASAVDLDRAANPPVQLASATTPPQLRPAQAVIPVTPPVQAAAAPIAPPAVAMATGLGVSLDDTAPLAAAGPAPSAPAPIAALPPLVTTPTAATAEPDALPWRGVF